MSQLVEIKSDFLPKITQSENFTILESDSLTDAIKDYKTSISETVKINMKLLSEIPLRQEFREELNKRFESMITKDLENDELFEKKVEISRYAKDLFNRIDSYFRETFRFNKERKEKLQYESFLNSRLFLNSDLPLSFLKILNASLYVEMDYIDIFEKEIRKERVDLLVSRKNRTKFGRVCKEHNAWASKFAEIRNAMDRARVKLIWYIDFNNSKTVDEIFKDKTIKTSSLDKKTLFAFIAELENQVIVMEKLNLTKLSFDFCSPSDTDDGTMTVVKMIKTLSNT